MRTDLRDRLTDLAAHTPAASPPGDLWVRGVRRRRAALAGRAVIAVVLAALVGLGGWTWQSSRPVQPADTHGSPHLPDRFFTPSPWLSAFDGPPGPLVALAPYRHESLTHTSDAVYGVTAVTGQYGRLELPAQSGDVGLSPNGRWVAYWTRGTPSGSVNTSQGPPVTGIAVYDTTTGAISRTSIPTAHGLSPQQLLWDDAGHLLFVYARWRNGDDHDAQGDREGQERTGVWDAKTGFKPFHVKQPVDFEGSATNSGSPLIAPGYENNQYWRCSLATPHWCWSLVLGDADAADPSMALSTDGRRLAMVSGGSNGEQKTPNTIVAGDIPKRPPPHTLGTSVSLPVVPHSGHTFAVLSWLDRRHVAALRQDVFSSSDATFRIDSVDVRTGAAHVLVQGLSTTVLRTQFASDLLAAPSVHGQPPSAPWNLRFVLGGTALALVVVALYLWGATRGRRA